MCLPWPAWAAITKCHGWAAQKTRRSLLTVLRLDVQDPGRPHCLLLTQPILPAESLPVLWCLLQTLIPWQGLNLTAHLTPTLSQGPRLHKPSRVGKGASIWMGETHSVQTPAQGGTYFPSISALERGNFLNGKRIKICHPNWPKVFKRTILLKQKLKSSVLFLHSSLLTQIQL